MIYVKAKAGRVVYDSIGGNKIPGDAFVPVTNSDYVQMLIGYGDVEVGNPPAAPVTNSPPPTLDSLAASGVPPILAKQIMADYQASAQFNSPNAATPKPAQPSTSSTASSSASTTAAATPAA